MNACCTTAHRIARPTERSSAKCHWPRTPRVRSATFQSPGSLSVDRSRSFDITRNSFRPIRPQVAGLSNGKRLRCSHPLPSHLSSLPSLRNTGGNFSSPVESSASTASINRRIRSSGLIPSASALKFVTSRWRSTGNATCSDVVEPGVEPALQRRPGLRPQHEVLACPRTGAPGHVIADERRHVVRFGLRPLVLILARPRPPDKPHRVADHVVGHRHAADDPLQG